MTKQNMWLMTPDMKVIQVKILQDGWNKKYFPNGRECITTQHKTGIWDYYILWFDAEEGNKYCESAQWICKTNGLLPTGNFVIVHKVWNDDKDEEFYAPIDIDVKQMKELFKQE